MGFLDFLTDSWEWDHRARVISAQVAAASNQSQLDAIYATLTPDEKANSWVNQTFSAAAGKTKADVQISNPLKDLIKTLLDEWVKKVAELDMKDPSKASETLASLTTEVMELSGGALAIELALGGLPNGMGTVASTRVSTLMAWLGFGAVITAVAHDPVKIGLLRPYQDSLEATFRNRRPGDQALFTAYQQRSLSATKIEDVTAISDQVMTQIETENDAYYDTEIAKWGYSPYFSNALKDAATKTLSFGNLMALAKQGRLNRGMAIFSLWGYGLDRRLMKVALEALDQANEVANYEGFRAQIEPAYVEGSIDEPSLIEYWNKLHIPQDVQDLMLPRFRKKRAAYLAKQDQGAPAKERDLTVSQIHSAYQNLLLDRARAQNMILTMGYSLDETKILLDLAELRRKLPSAATLKRLPLSDYEKAYKNKLITQEAVLARMVGEYTETDIILERQLLEAGKA